MLLGPIFAQQGWKTSPFNIYPAKGRYMWRDLERICAAEGIDFVRPDPFPQHSVLAARVATALSGSERGRFCTAVFVAEFRHGLRIDSPEVISDILVYLGLGPSALDAAATDEIRSALRGSVEEARSLGIFGAPSFVASDGELFWGYDRLDAALDWAAGRP